MVCIFTWHEWWSWIESAFRWIESGLILDVVDFLNIRIHISEPFLLAADSQGSGWLSISRKKKSSSLDTSYKSVYQTRMSSLCKHLSSIRRPLILWRMFYGIGCPLSSYHSHLRDKFFSTVCVQLLPDASSRNFFLDNTVRVWFQVIIRDLICVIICLSRGNGHSTHRDFHPSRRQKYGHFS